MSSSSLIFFSLYYFKKVVYHKHQLRFIYVCIFLLLSNSSSATSVNLHLIEEKLNDGEAYTYLTHLSDFITDPGVYIPEIPVNSTSILESRKSTLINIASTKIDWSTTDAIFNFENSMHVVPHKIEKQYLAPNQGYGPLSQNESRDSKSEIPEPQNWILMMLAIGSFAVFRLRHSKSL